MSTTVNWLPLRGKLLSMLSRGESILEIRVENIPYGNIFDIQITLATSHGRSLSWREPFLLSSERFDSKHMESLVQCLEEEEMVARVATSEITVQSATTPKPAALTPNPSIAPLDRATLQSRRLLQIVRAIVPRKIDNEQLGDEYELIAMREAEGMHPWLNQWHTIKCCFWALAYTFVELCKPGAIFAVLYRFFSGA